MKEYSVVFGCDCAQSCMQNVEYIAAQQTQLSKTAAGGPVAAAAANSHASGAAAAAALSPNALPSELVLMQNMHRLQAVVSNLKTPRNTLDPQRRDAKHRYEHSLNAYVSTQLGKPIEKISVFFDGVLRSEQLQNETRTLVT